MGRGCSGTTICAVLVLLLRYYCCSCSSDGSVVLTEVPRGDKKWSVKAHKKGVNDIAWCHSQQWLASCGLGRAILLWQISISTPVFTLEGHQASVQVISSIASDTVLL